jgi:hypothetical protein
VIPSKRSIVGQTKSHPFSGVGSKLAAVEALLRKLGPGAAVKEKERQKENEGKFKTFFEGRHGRFDRHPS